MSKTAYQSIFRPGLFAGQVAVVTGGGSGIGRCTAHELASLGAKIALIGRRQEKLDAVRRELDQVGAETVCLVCDIRDEGMVKDAVSQIIGQFGRIDHLVNNAGGQFAMPLEDISKKGWEAVVGSNLTGGFLMARECYLQSMREHGGAIVNMAADMWNGMPMMGHSGAARAGMVNFTMTAALEWGAANVRVNAVAPGLVFSSGLDHYPPAVQQQLLEYRHHVPLGRTGTEAEVAAAIVFLLSEGAAYISGATICIDGAYAMASPNYKCPARERASPLFDGFHLSVSPELARQ